MKLYQSEWDSHWDLAERADQVISVQDVELVNLEFSAQQRKSSVVLKGCTWNQVRLSSDLLDKDGFTELTHCSITQTHWVDLDLRFWKWDQCEWQFVDVRNSRLDRVVFDSVRFESCAIAYALFRDCVFRQCVDLHLSERSHAVFERCVFVEMDFRGWSVDPSEMGKMFRACTFVQCKAPLWFEALCRDNGQIWLKNADEVAVAASTSTVPTTVIAAATTPKPLPSRFGSLERIGDAG